MKQLQYLIDNYKLISTLITGTIGVTMFYMNITGKIDEIHTMYRAMPDSTQYVTKAIYQEGLKKQDEWNTWIFYKKSPEAQWLK